MSLLTHHQINDESLSAVREAGSSAQFECARVIHAAIISRNFRDRLLANPVKSIEGGYCGEKFFFTREEKLRLMMIRAVTLDEFARQLTHVIEGEVIPQMAFAR